MKLDKEFMKKHQFWLLLGLAVFLWTISLALVFIGPRAKAAEEAKNYQKAETEFQNKLKLDLKNVSFLTKWKERQDVFTKRKNVVWEEAWKTQAELMTWPGNLATELANASFGDKIEPDSIQRYKNELYRSQFASMDAFLALRTEPLYFPVGFERSVLGEHTWKEDPTREECWLAQEELWARREVFKLLTATLKSIGAFTEIREPGFKNVLMAAGGPAFDVLAKKNPQLQPILFKERPKPPEAVKSQLFRNHSWEVEIFLEKEPSSNRLQISGKSTIKNINPHGRSLALVNGGKGLQLRVRKEANTLDLLPIEGQLLPPEGTSAFEKPTTSPGLTLAAGFDLEEVFTTATSPIKRLEMVEVGAPAQSHRLAAIADLVMNKLAPVPPPEDPANPGGGPPNVGGGPPPNVGGGPPPNVGGGPPNMGGGPPGQGGAAAPAVSEKTPNDFVRKRYTLVNDQVRRIPVAFVIIVDQAQRSEVLAAVANSRARIQTSQVQWRHSEPVAPAAPPVAAGAGGMGGGMGSQPVVDPMDKGKPAEKPGLLAEDSQNLIELSVYGVATLFDRFKLPPPEQKP